MSGKGWIIFVAICVVLFGGLVIWSGRDRVDVSGVDTEKIQPASDGSGQIADHVYGNPDAKVVLIEYGDFQCPGCGSAHPIVKTVTEKYKDDVAFVYRNFPLTNIHPNARAAAASAEAAGKLGKYWQVHNALFENQSAWSNASTSERGNVFANFATQAGLKKEQFTATLNSESANINKKINFDIALGRKLNVTGTPTFYLNGKKLDNEKYGSEEALDKTIRDALKDSGVDIAEPTKE